MNAPATAGAATGGNGGNTGGNGGANTGANVTGTQPPGGTGQQQGQLVPGQGGGAPVAGQQQQQPPPPPAYIPTHFIGQLPALMGDVAKEMRKITPADQRQNANDFHTFLWDVASDLRDLNGDTKLFTALVTVPGTHKVKVLYGTGLGTALIGQTNPAVANKVLTLFGEGGADIGPPTILILDKSIRDVVRVKSLTDADILTVL